MNFFRGASGAGFAIAFVTDRGFIPMKIAHDDARGHNRPGLVSIMADIAGADKSSGLPG
jgi:hypothetical protein